MDKVQKQKLLTLAKFLRVLPPERFDMTHWFRDSYTGGWPTNMASCGTTACAFGWAVTIFPDLELNAIQQVAYKPKGGEEQLFPFFHEAAAAYFGITKRQADYLFTDDEAMAFTPKQEAKRIEKFVKANGRLSSRS